MFCRLVLLVDIALSSVVEEEEAALAVVEVVSSRYPTATLCT